MGILVAVETTGESCSVALFDEDDLLVQSHAEIPRNHDRLLGQLFQQTLILSQTSPSDITAIAVSVGPGSYTGIRIGLSFAIGFAFASSISVIPVGTLDAIAYDVRDVGIMGGQNRVVSLIPASPTSLYAALYEIEPEFQMLTSPYTIPAEQLPPLLDENVFAAGPGIALLDSKYGEYVARNSESLTARAVGTYAWDLFRKGVSVAPDKVEPLYIGTMGGNTSS